MSGKDDSIPKPKFPISGKPGIISSNAWKNCLFGGVSPGLAGLNRLQSALTAAFGIKFGFAAGQAAEKRRNLFTESGCAFDVDQDFFIREVVGLVAVRAGRFHGKLLPSSHVRNNSQTASPFGVSGRYIKIILPLIILPTLSVAGASALASQISSKHFPPLSIL